METWQGKHFSITDPKGVNTVIYEVYITKKEFLHKYPKYTIAGFSLVQFSNKSIALFIASYKFIYIFLL